ncbi:hypothetical protein HGRIS_013102 [Hohenbuehelia grisea]|uniref:Uncharacterized protein n=1 Tax=Hohenbuehelia grisea TaxID=104357 RepID=A0ABR3IUH7_9AGAR
MPPSHPSSRAGAGLPSNPRAGVRAPSSARSAATAPSRYDNDRPSSSSSRVIRPQKSTGSLPRRERSQSRSRPPVPNLHEDDRPLRAIQPQKSLGSLPPPRSSRSRSRDPPPKQPPARPRSLSRVRRNELGRASDYLRESDSSPSSASSSSSSSLFDRPKATSGYSSSRTSFDDAGEDRKFSDYGAGRNHASAGNRQSSSLDLGNRYEDSVNEPEQGEGWNIWGRVAAAAGTLTVNVSKAWAANVSMTAGEGTCLSRFGSESVPIYRTETPVGQESRLTRAMKSFHIDKARDPTELPEWLFEPHERGRGASNRLIDEVHEAERAEPPRSRGLRDVFDAAGASSSTASTSGFDPPPSRSGTPVNGQPSKAADRLRAMRDAKRSALTVGSSRSSEARAQESKRSDGPDVTPPLPGTREQRPQRIGLPSGPALRSRRP